ncbi:MAG: hypothetical protein CL678_01790 [Bdellovibrionaceae bacterium]|nr:hypothetical protein [Pseudobdellovibrionaceae bacterium]
MKSTHKTYSSKTVFLIFGLVVILFSGALITYFMKFRNETLMPRLSAFKAALSGNWDTISPILESSALHLETTLPVGGTLFVASARGDQIEIAKKLLIKGAEINAQDERKRTALYWTVENNSYPFFKFLIEKGADLHIRDDQGDTVLLRSAYLGRTQFVKDLISHNVNVKQEGQFGVTAAMMAASQGHSEILTLLSQTPLPIDQSDRFGKTPLMYAAENGHLDAVKTLIQQRANPALQTDTGKTALELAELKNHPKVADWLKTLETSK